MASKVPEQCQLCSLYYDSGHFCAKLSGGELNELHAHSPLVNVKRGQVLSDDVLERWPILAIDSGVLCLRNLLHDGRRTIAAFFLRGDILDMRAAENRRLGDLIALSPVSMCRLSPEVFDRILSSNSHARTMAWKSLSSQVHRALSHASDLAKKQALEKLASFVFECRRRQNGLHKEYVEIPIRRRYLAEYLGMQPETVSRCFRDLEERAIIKVSDLSVIRILDLPALRRIANGDRVVQDTGQVPDPVFKIMTKEA
jgi:CRP/FNR family transcriptional regulator